jgi:N-acetylglucosaminyldiphosphoundecaprenol N-acetyl-beta-D-mannosaminyltransferase
VAADSARPRIQRIDLLGAPLDVAARAEFERLIAEHMVGSNPGLLHVITLNPEYVMAAQRSDAFRAALMRADLSVPDGVGVVVAFGWLGGIRLDRVTGVDLVSWLLSTHLKDAPRVFLLGSPASVAGLQGRHPTRVVGRWGAGSPDPSDDAESIDRIRATGANAVLVGYGAPAQVLWIDRNRDALALAGVRVAVGVGGALDYLAGTVDRAPEPLRRAGLEWAYRLVREPWRWRRQLALPAFVVLVLRARLHQFRSTA